MSTPKTFSILVLVLGLGGTIEAHDPGLSRADVTLDAHGATAEVTFARRDVELLAPIEALGRELLELDGAAPDAVRVASDSSDGVRYSLHFPSTRPRELRFPALARLARGHRQYVAVRDARGAILAQGLVGAASAALTIPDVAGPSSAPGRFFALGIEHLLAGWDHLLFLLALLLAGGGTRRALGIVTAFTAAHSVTLAFAALDVVRVPPAIVEPVIAASIVWVGLENLLRRDTRRRWAVAFGCGLVHGLGFASALADAGLATRGIGAALGSLLAFNVGVETGQLLVLALAVPAAWAIRQIPRLDVGRAAATASASVAACGAYWLVERTIL